MPILLLLLNQRLGLSIIQDLPNRSIKVGSAEYLPITPDISGFNDWLRTSAGTLIGVRLDTLGDPRVETAELDYAYCDEAGKICIFFSENRAFDERASSDQDFLYNRIFQTADGELCLAFAASDLSEREMADVRMSNGEWLEASSS